MTNKSMINKLLHLVKPLRAFTRRAKGFTLIETLVAVLLLTSAIAGPLTIAARGLMASLTARDQVTAFYLAQDAIEYVRFLRDSNRLQNVDWLTGLNACTSTDGSVTCYMDPLQGQAVTCSGNCPVLKYDATNHFFSYTTGNNTTQQYMRNIKIVKNAGNTEASVYVNVLWSDPVAHFITVRENLLNWQ